MYEVFMTVTADAEMAAAYRTARRHAPMAARLWLQRLLAAVDTLDTMPQRCSIAAESTALGYEVRELLFGKRRGKFRILFTINGNIVTVRHIIRASRGPIPADEF